MCKKILIFFIKNFDFLSFSSFSEVFCTKNALSAAGFVRLTGLEPARRKTPDPKSDASTNSATGAFHHVFPRFMVSERVQRYKEFFIPPKVYGQILSEYLFLDENRHRFGRCCNPEQCQTPPVGGPGHNSDKLRSARSTRWGAWRRMGGRSPRPSGHPRSSPWGSTSCTSRSRWRQRTPRGW